MIIFCEWVEFVAVYNRTGAIGKIFDNLDISLNQ